jgi:hypothetical protein
MEYPSSVSSNKISVATTVRADEPGAPSGGIGKATSDKYFRANKIFTNRGNGHGNVINKDVSSTYKIITSELPILRLLLFI